MKKVLVFSLLMLSAVMAGSLLAAPSKTPALNKVEKAQARVAKLQAESVCLQKLVSDAEITKIDMAEIMLNDGTCIAHFKRLAKRGK